MKEEVHHERAKATTVVNGKVDEGNVLGIKCREDFITLGGAGGSSLELKPNASQVGPGNYWDRKVGLLRKAAGNMRDSDVNTGRTFSSICWSNQVNDNI